MMSTQKDNDLASVGIMPAGGASPGQKGTPEASPGEQAVLIRFLTPGDEEDLLGMYSRLSLRSIYRKFHIPFPRVPE